MSDDSIATASVAQYQFEVEIDAPPQRVWSALVQDINAWWLPDFRMVAPDSRVRLEPRAGGGLIEESAEHGSLLWHTVQWIRPREHTVYLVGHIAPDWGGPACTHLKLAVEARGQGSVLIATDAHFGRVSEANITSLKQGWTQLFRDGLKQFIEHGTRRDRPQ